MKDKKVRELLREDRWSPDGIAGLYNLARQSPSERRKELAEIAFDVTRLGISTNDTYNGFLLYLFCVGEPSLEVLQNSHQALNNAVYQGWAPTIKKFHTSITAHDEIVHELAKRLYDEIVNAKKP